MVSQLRTNWKVAQKLGKTDDDDDDDGSNCNTCHLEEFRLGGGGGRCHMGLHARFEGIVNWIEIFLTSSPIGMTKIG